MPDDAEGQGKLESKCGNDQYDDDGEREAQILKHHGPCAATQCERERNAFPDERMALLPTMGGQTALNTSLSLFRDGTL